MLTRRAFARSLGSTIAFLSLEPTLGWASEESGVSRAASRLYRKAFIVDCNTLADFCRLRRPLEERVLRAVQESGITVVKATLGGVASTFEEAVADLGRAERFIEKRPDLLMKIVTVADLQRAKQDHRMGIIYSFEGVSMLEEKVERIGLFRGLGVRVMQLTYNRSSPFGTGCLDGELGGLTELGRQAVAAMNETGVALDLSHSNAETTRQGIATSKKPVLISHAGCRAVFNHPRNKEDRDLRALAQKGGVIGIYLLPFLTAAETGPTIEDFMRHLTHALNVCGEDHVGIGTDRPMPTILEADFEAMRKLVEQRKAAGIAAPGEGGLPYVPGLNTPRKLEIITDALLKRGISSRVTEKVLGGNFRRVLGEIWAC